METTIKLHAHIFTSYSACGTDIRGIIYTAGFEKGDYGFLVNTISNDVKKLEVVRSISAPIDKADILNPTCTVNEYTYAEYVVDGFVKIVFFKLVNTDEEVILPPHLLASIS